MATRDSLDDDNSDSEEVKPPNLHLKTQPLSLACHPRRANIFAVGLCDGSVELRDCWGAAGRPALRDALAKLDGRLARAAPPKDAAAPAPSSARRPGLASVLLAVLPALAAALWWSIF